MSFYDIPVLGKRLALLRELVPKAETIAVLQDPNMVAHDVETREIEEAARGAGALHVGAGPGAPNWLDLPRSMLSQRAILQPDLSRLED